MPGHRQRSSLHRARWPARTRSSPKAGHLRRQVHAPTRSTVWRPSWQVRGKQERREAPGHFEIPRPMAEQFGVAAGKRALHEKQPVGVVTHRRSRRTGRGGSSLGSPPLRDIHQSSWQSFSQFSEPGRHPLLCGRWPGLGYQVKPRARSGEGSQRVPCSSASAAATASPFLSLASGAAFSTDTASVTASTMRAFGTCAR